MSSSIAAPPAPIVFFDIAGLADAHLSEFYAKVFSWQAGTGGVLSVPVIGPRPATGPQLDGTLRVDPAGKLLYIGVPDVTAKLNEVTANGGKVIAPRFEVKGVAVIGLFTDPAGNGMGLVELAADGQVKVPH
jgi:predicted enzyme related to lactoylglutathione lyase